MDEKYIEMAGELTEAQTNSGLAQCAKQAFSSTDLEPHQYKVLECVECEDPLPVFRMQKGFELCVSCQSEKEKRLKR